MSLFSVYAAEASKVSLSSEGTMMMLNRKLLSKLKDARVQLKMTVNSLIQCAFLWRAPLQMDQLCKNLNEGHLRACARLFPATSSLVSDI